MQRSKVVDEIVEGGELACVSGRARGHRQQKRREGETRRVRQGDTERCSENREQRKKNNLQDGWEERSGLGTARAGERMTEGEGWGGVGSGWEVAGRWRWTIEG